MEAALNGTPHLVELRSVSRAGLSAVTVIFKDGTDIWFARQIVLERVRGVEATLPKVAGKPELSPVSGGLGEIYQFVVRSDHHSPTQLRTILDWEIVPKLRSVPGVIEVNTMGGDLKEYQVVIDRGRLHAHEMTLKDVADALARANVNVGGGYLDRAARVVHARRRRPAQERGRDRERRACARPPTARRCSCGTSRRCSVGAALRHGVITRDGEGEAVTGITMMLIGAQQPRRRARGEARRSAKIQTRAAARRDHRADLRSRRLRRPHAHARCSRTSSRARSSSRSCSRSSSARSAARSWSCSGSPRRCPSRSSACTSSASPAT